ncbi:MAG: NUDIX hydrolase [Candidatus Omnitrophica bacterium]|nr:NUDIX hydrolase [Candidatus Omnitrophota bacterium]MDD5081277.1 NUDIX hydrolase [Candidatus Omnitrophota bacterium]MDD5441085.1 NUDIX hydrolase [Candidatus Omnitrophota bacterium]
MVKEIYQGRIFKLMSVTKKLPTGRETTVDVIEHNGAALIIPFISADKVIMLRQYRAVIDKYIYELPAGTLEENERPLNCAKREIIEETGYSAKKFTKLGAIYPVPGYSTEKITIYKAEQLCKRKVSFDADEIIENEIFSKKDVKKLFITGKIIDAKTICALAFCGII